MILVIGNGPSADTPEVARAIERATRVVRMNNWKPGRHTGDRCDIWGTSYNVDVPERDAPEIWWTGWPFGQGAADYEAALAAQSRRFDRVASEGLILSVLARTRPKEPSTGLTIALMAEELGEPLMLAGYDHFSKPTHHYWEVNAIDDPLKWHSPDVERAIIGDLVERGARLVTSG